MHLNQEEIKKLNILKNLSLTLLNKFIWSSNEKRFEKNKRPICS